MTAAPSPEARSLTPSHWLARHAPAEIFLLKETVLGDGRNAWTIRVRPTNIRAITSFARERGFAGTRAAARQQLPLPRAPLASALLDQTVDREHSIGQLHPVTA